ncbi:sugar nucleotide-binding protein (plasmid) [Rhizobium grahamii]|uniref:dTDP-4-dehydrorhamnose reductase n=1 Tax=Rhizobium grahamii TaxID=1120045 RepID=A0A5Q0CDR2_9HYPH|nr:MULTISPECIES: sugar nucleotide-binding protein [Rhizobium]QFY63936.1 sugar nucleotide-binding protein [Rhizobium grahamii]QRM52818.1 sugar nucleotide-binding protein [Rhizobium sp. BG6]
MTDSRILLLGAGGMLGSRFALALADKDIVTLSREQLEVARPRELMDTVALTQASVIINCAADTDVEGAEANPASSFSINAILPGLLAQAAAGAMLVHFSSTGCYGRSSDENAAPHSDFAPLSPTTVHHKSKAAGEIAIREAACRHLILRLGWLYGGSATHRKNFVRARIAEARQKTELASDPYQTGSPTNVDDVVVQTLALLEARIGGTFNCVATGAVSRFDYVRHILRSAGLFPRLVPTRFQRLAPVSENESAVNDKLNLLGLNKMPTWDEGVSAYVASLLADEGHQPNVE